MRRVHNFCAGPAALPEAVLKRAQEEMLDWADVGASVLEVSHRSKPFIAVVDRAERSLRRLMSISSDYAILFIQGGASMQFSAVPLNLSLQGEAIDQLVTGQWSKKALHEGRRFGSVNVVATSEENNFTSVPPVGAWQLNSNASYFHYCPNETIGGLECSFVPQVDVPLVADMSSTILSRPLDISQFGAVYAGAQKNIGPAGLCIVIVRRDLLGRARPCTPAMLNWQLTDEHGSMYNTPPSFAIYLAGLVFEWLESRGGLSAMEVVNRRKAAKLYATIDQSPFYFNQVECSSRSLMNVPFSLADSGLDSLFLEQAEENHLCNLRGHRSTGGMRASLYNAVEERSVDALCDFMRDFEKRYS